MYTRAHGVENIYIVPFIIPRKSDWMDMAVSKNADHIKIETKRTNKKTKRALVMWELKLAYKKSSFTYGNSIDVMLSQSI